MLNYNGKEMLKPCLHHLYQQEYQDFRILVVDNASTDGSLEMLRNEHPKVEVLALSENLGFCGGNNRGHLYPARNE